MTFTPGPQGIGASFIRKVSQLMAKGKTELQARRIASNTTINNQKRKKK